MKVRVHVALAALLLGSAGSLLAQEPPPGSPGRRGIERDSLRPRMLNVEAALRFKQELKLSDGQVNQLESLRKEIVAERQARARDMIDTESRIAAGYLSRDDARKQFESKRDAERQTFEQQRDRISKILSAEQRQQLESETREHMRSRMRDFHDRMGPRMRGHGRMGPGFRSWRDF